MSKVLLDPKAMMAAGDRMQGLSNELVGKAMGVGAGMPAPMPPRPMVHVPAEIAQIAARGTWEGGSQFALAAELKGRSAMIQAADGTLSLDQAGLLIGLIPGGKAIYEKVSGPLKRVVNAGKKVANFAKNAAKLASDFRKNPKRFIGKVYNAAKLKVKTAVSVAKSKAVIVGAIIDSGAGLVTFTTSMVAIELTVTDPTAKVQMLEDLGQAAMRGEHGYALQTGLNLQEAANNPAHLERMAAGDYGAGGQSNAALVHASRGEWGEAAGATYDAGATTVNNQVNEIKQLFLV